MYQLALILLCLLYQTSFSQGKITGNVADTKGRPLAGASVSILNSYDGGTTDSLGNFEISSGEKGDIILEVSISGYPTYNNKLVFDGARLQHDIVLKELITELKAVVLSAGSFEASDQKRTTVLNSIDIVTTASANADITAAIKTLPGAQQVGESEGLFVRGGTANESRTYIDGTLVNNFYFSSQPGLAQRGRFNPFLFKGTIFSAGGYSALYGQALSSALLLESIDLPEVSSAQLSFSYLSAGAGFQKLAKNKRYSWGLTYNYMHLGVAYKLIRQKPDYFIMPEMHNADANFRIRTKNGMVKYYGMFASVKAGFRYKDIDSLVLKDAFGLKNFNQYHNISWKEKIGNGYKIQLGVSYSNNADDIFNELQDANNRKQSVSVSPLYFYKNFNLATNGNYANARMTIEKKLSGLSAWRFGTEYNYSNEYSDLRFPDGFTVKDTVKDHLTALYTEADIYITNNIAVKAGVRAEYTTLLAKWNLGPRLSVAYKLKSDDQLSFAYGIFYQNPERRYMSSPYKLGFSKASHYILQYQRLSNSRTFRSEVFYKNYVHLYKLSNEPGKAVIANNGGRGYAKGIEFFWRDKKSIKGVDYWFSYSYLDTERDFMNYPDKIAPSFAAKHTASLVIKKFVTTMKTMVNASYTYASGRPYYDIRKDTYGNNKIFDYGRTKDFNSLSFSLNYLPMINRKGANKFSVFVFSITNVLGSDNIFGYNYSADGSNKQAILPPSKRFYFLGCFLSFGVDRTDDAINNSL